MPALSAPATWRAHPQSFQGFLYIHAPAIVMQAQVNQSTFNFPLYEFAFDSVAAGAWGDVKPGMTILFGSTAGADDLGRNRVRAITSTKIWINYSSAGNRDGEANLSNNIYLTVLDDYRVWAKTPRIAPDGTIYKDGALSWATYGQNSLPVANGGPGYAEFVNTVTSKITVSFDADSADCPSFATQPGASITTYAWDVDDGTITVGTSSTSAITATFPAGFRWVRLTVTDDNGQAHTCMIPVFAAEKTGSNAPKACKVINRSLRDAQEIEFELYESIAEGTYPDGALVMYWERENYGGTVAGQQGPSGREHMKFIGWHDQERESSEAGKTGVITGTRLKCVDVMGRLAQLRGFTHVVEHAASPSNWLQQNAPNVDRLMHLVLQWHTTALDLADWQWSGTGSTYAVKALGAGSGDPKRQMQRLAAAIAYTLQADWWGRLWTEPDPILQASGSRTATVIVDLDETDWATFRHDGKRTPHVAWMDGYAIVASNTTIAAVYAQAPGKAPSQGRQDDKESEWLVVNQAELNTRLGMQYARATAPQRMFTIELAHNPDVIAPAWGEWVRSTISAANAARRGLAFADERFVPHEVIIHYDYEKGVKRGEVVVERETSGPDAEFIPPPASRGRFLPNLSLSPFSIDFTVPQFENPDAGPTAIPTDLIAFHRESSACAIASTTDEWVSTPVWENRSTGISGNNRWAIADPSDYNRYFLVTTAGLFRNENPKRGESWVQILDNSMLVGPNFPYYHHIVMSGHRPGWIALGGSFYNVHVSFDWGETWQDGSLSAAADTSDEKYQIHLHPGVHNDPDGDALMYAFAGGGIYQSTDWGLTWAAATTQLPPTNYSNGNIEVPFMQPEGIDGNLPNASQHIYAYEGWHYSPFPERAHWLYRSRNQATSWSALLSGAGAGSWDSGWGVPCQRSIVAHTPDCNHINLWIKTIGQVNNESRVAYTVDAGDIITQCTNQPTSTTNLHSVGLNGFPMNEQFILAWWERTSGGIAGGLKLTKDRGQSAWIDLTGNLVSGSIFADMRIAYAEAGLAAFS